MNPGTSEYRLGSVGGLGNDRSKLSNAIAEGEEMTLLDWGLIALGVGLMALAAWGGAKLLWWKS